MAGIKDISSIWKNIKEIDLKPIRDAAMQPVKISLVGETGAGRHTLADQMRTDPARPGIHTQSAVAFPSIEAQTEAPAVDLIIVILDATREEFRKEESLVKKWRDAGSNVLVLINKIDLLENNELPDHQLGWHAVKVLAGSVNDTTFLQREFVPAVLELLPQQQIALGRQFPLFRLTIAKQLINDTCFSNAAYSFSTGLAEIVPVLDIPLNVTDMIVLTKSQAFLAYKLGLLVGFSTSWQDYVTEFGSVIGSGFLWRQIARSLIGLIPAWGIIPKVAVAYSGTYVVGNAILSWYLTGRHLSPKQMRALSVQAFDMGKEYARRLSERIPRPKLKRRKEGELTAGEPVQFLNQGEITVETEDGLIQVISPSDLSQIAGSGSKVADRSSETGAHPRHKMRSPFQLRKKRKAGKVAKTRTCLQCGKGSSADASFCQYCGAPFGA